MSGSATRQTSADRQCKITGELMQPTNQAQLESTVRAAAEARRSGDHARAVEIASHAGRSGIVHPVLLRIHAEGLALAGHYAEAGQLLNRALALAPNDPPTITDIGRVLVAEGRVAEAIVAFEAAVGVRPDYALAWLELGSAQDINGQLDAARLANERARALLPGNPEAPAALASLAMRRGEFALARTLAGEALAQHPGHAPAELVMAAVDLEEGQSEGARARAQALLDAGTLDERQVQVALALLGDSLDRLGRIQEAFDAYTRMNEATARANASRFGESGRTESHLAFVERLTRWFERQDRAGWREPAPAQAAPSPVRRHVFLLGYPRSGNTLVENILASLPGVCTLEERPTLAEADGEFLRNEAALDRLPHLDAALAARHREAYWQRVRVELPEVDGRVLVDMAPLNGIKLPMIARLFPDAAIVVCRRDPRDVVLSCFRRHFRVNASTYQMAGLERAARHYDAVMRLVDMHLATLPLRVHVIDYAALVADFDATTRDLAEFLGLPWDESVRDFALTAAGREVRTVSAAQVRRGLYDGTRQWERYREQLAPVLPLLEPWVHRFGYSP